MLNELAGKISFGFVLIISRGINGLRYSMGHGLIMCIDDK